MTARDDQFFVRFWGVRGSIACPGPDTDRYGGNTSCLEVRCGDQLFIFDAGTGIRELGVGLAQQGPLDADIFQAQMSCHDFMAGATLEPRPGVRMRTVPLNHPNRATGYRIEYGGKAICYVTDTEHVAGAPDRNILDLVAGADVMIYDATYTDAEFPKYVSWGHSTWEEGVRLCQAAGVRTLAIYHHLPGRSDDDLDAIGAEAARAFPGAVVAREGLILTP